MKIGMIWAQDVNGVIGKANRLPWNIPEDLQHFKNMTTGHPVIMGRKTWQSFPQKYRPLPNRTNIVMSRNLNNFEKPFYKNVFWVSTPQQALAAAASSPGSEQIWVIGGAEIFAQFLPLAEKIVITQINKTHTGDTFAPKLDNKWALSVSNSDKNWRTNQAGLEYRFLVWELTK